MQVNLPRGISAPDAATAVANIAAAEKNTGSKNKDAPDMTAAMNDIAEAATKKREEARETLEKNAPGAIDKETVKTALVRTVNVVDLVMPSRDLKYEVIDEVDRVQVQVVKKEDGEIIRKIPADEILQLVTRIHEILNADTDSGIDVVG